MLLIGVVVAYVFWCVFVTWSVILVYFFFFFKQKTAYEMRISDWSSDVCSSDLRDGCPPASGLVRCHETRRADFVRSHRAAGRRLSIHRAQRPRDRKSVV